MNKDVEAKKSKQFAHYVASILSGILTYFVKSRLETELAILQDLAFLLDLGFYLTLFIPFYFFISMFTHWLYSGSSKPNS